MVEQNQLSLHDHGSLNKPESILSSNYIFINFWNNYPFKIKTSYLQAALATGLLIEGCPADVLAKNSARSHKNPKCSLSNDPTYETICNADSQIDPGLADAAARAFGSLGQPNNFAIKYSIIHFSKLKMKFSFMILISFLKNLL